MTTQFKVAAISNNANSFGLYGYILMARDGTSYEVGRQKASYIPEWNMGDVVDLPIENGEIVWARVYCEIPRSLPRAPKDVVDEVWGDVSE